MVLERGDSSRASETTPLLLPVSSSPSPTATASEKLASVPKSFGNIVIAIVGAGVLGLPYTFMRTGWLAGALMLLAVAALTYYCMMLLVWTKRKLAADGYVKVGSFGDVGYLTCGAVGKALVDFMIVLSQAGFCVSYLIFVSTTLSSIIFPSQPRLNNTAGADGARLGQAGAGGTGLGLVGTGFVGAGATILGMSAKSALIWAQMPFQVGLNLIRRLTQLAPLSIFADVVDVAAMAVVMVENVVKLTRAAPAVRAFTTLSRIPYGTGVAIYAFEGIGMILPLETEADQKSKFGKVLGVAVALITVTYGCFGLLGYLAFGDATQDIVTLNLGRGLLTDAVKLGLSINLFFTFPLMMNPVHQVFESRFNGGRYSFLFRTLSVLATTLVALMVPNFSDFLSLVGSSVCCVLGFVLPAVFHLVACRDVCSRFEISVDFMIICFGIVFGVLGTASSVQKIFFGSV